MELSLVVGIAGILTSILAVVVAFTQALYNRRQSQANIQQVQVAERALRLQEQDQWRKEIDRQYSFEIAMLKHECTGYKEECIRYKEAAEQYRRELLEAREELTKTREELQNLRRQYHELVNEANLARRAL